MVREFIFDIWKMEDGRYALNKFLKDEYEQVNGQTAGAEDKP